MKKLSLKVSLWSQSVQISAVIRYQDKCQHGLTGLGSEKMLSLSVFSAPLKYITSVSVGWTASSSRWFTDQMPAWKGERKIIELFSVMNLDAFQGATDSNSQCLHRCRWDATVWGWSLKPKKVTKFRDIKKEGFC